jgi:hypothetical protein
MISLVVGSYYGMPPLLLTWLEPAFPGMPTVLTRVRCLSLKPDMDREVRSHADSRISAKVQSWELGLSRVFRPDDHQNHPELRHVSSLYYRLRHAVLTLLLVLDFSHSCLTLFPRSSAGCGYNNISLDCTFLINRKFYVRRRFLFFACFVILWQRVVHYSTGKT